MQVLEASTTEERMNSAKRREKDPRSKMLVAIALLWSCSGRAPMRERGGCSSWRTDNWKKKYRGCTVRLFGTNSLKKGAV
jgi:hypothetical protein